MDLRTFGGSGRTILLVFIDALFYHTKPSKTRSRTAHNRVENLPKSILKTLEITPYPPWISFIIKTKLR
jgi:hypothetical protein